ncbi:MAG: nucleoside recognition protein [Clostridia bacterium]|nr:nucleoside recognition protein [Clostridia bacterium]
MLNFLWPIFISVSFIYAFLTGNIDKVNNSIFESTKSAVELSINLIGTMCFWNGIMEIATKTSIIDKLTKGLQPLITFLFPEIEKENRVNKEISLNIIANILGLGNAATPTGLKVMKSLQNENKNKEKISNSMIMFIVINTASLQLIPTTVIAIRSSMASSNPTKILIPVWIATVCAAATAVIITKIFTKRSS